MMMKLRSSYLLLLVTIVLVGCSYFQSKGFSEKAPQSTASSEPTPNMASQNASLLEATPKNSKTLDKILFKGDNMTLFESEHSDFEPPQFKPGKKSCLNQADEIVEKKLSALGFKGHSEYFKFEAIETSSFGADKFTLSFGKTQFSKMSPESLKLLDEDVGYTDSRKLYFIKNKTFSYLLLIGHESATSGMGHLYSLHLLIPLGSNKPALEFRSISEDPRRVRVDDFDAVYYLQIDPPYVGAVKETASKSMRLTASLFSIDNANNKKLETKFDFNCEDVNKISDTK